MKLECTRKELVDAIDFVVPVTAVRSPDPLFQSVRLAADSNGLQLLACDGEMWAQRTIPAAVDVAGSLCVQGRVLKELITSLPDGPVILDSQDGIVIVRCGASDWRLRAYEADEFPSWPNFEGTTEISMNFGELSHAIEGVAYAVANDNSRPILTGVLFEYNGQQLTFVATNTHRLAVSRLGREGIGGEVKAVVPEKALRCIRLLPLTSEDTINLKFESERLLVEAGESRVLTQLLNGVFPQWERVVPEQTTRAWTMDRVELIEHLKRIQILARDSCNRVCFGGDGDHVLISARSDEKGDAKEEVVAVNSNGDIQIAFNGRYVLDALQSFDSDSVIAEMTEPSRPAVFKPRHEGEDTSFCVIMPMALN